MQPIQLSSVDAAESAVHWTSVSDADLQVRLTGAITGLACRVVRPDATTAVGTGTFVEPNSTLAPGVRVYRPSAADLAQVGANVLVFSGTGMETREVPIIIVPGDPYGLPGSRYSISFTGIWKDEPMQARRVVPFTAVSSADPTTRLDASALTWTVYIVRADGSVVTGTGSVVQSSTLALGVCYYRASAEDVSKVGPGVVRLSAPGAETREIEFYSLPFDPYTAFPTTGFVWADLIARARVYIGDDQDDTRGFIALDKWMLFAQVEYQALRRHWTRMGLVRRPLITTAFAGPSTSLAGVEAIAGVAQDTGGQYPRVLPYKETIWGTTNSCPAHSWSATGAGGDLAINLEPADTGNYLVKWIAATPYVTDVNARVDLPVGADERLVLGMAKRALVKDSSRSQPLEELIAQQDAQIAFLTTAQVRSPSVTPRVRGNSPSPDSESQSRLTDPRYWRYY